jgi:hypothetical protein
MYVASQGTDPSEFQVCMPAATLFPTDPINDFHPDLARELQI